MPFESSDALKKFISESSIEDFKKNLSQMSYFEIAEGFLHLQNQPTIEPQNKIDYLFEFIDSQNSLENLGKHLSVEQFIKIIEYLEQNSRYKNRLSFILTGLTPQVFSQALLHMQSHHLEFIKQENLLEPLQYHITQFFHEGESLSQKLEENIALFIQNLKIIEPGKQTPETLNDLISKIDSFRNHLSSYLEKIVPVLSLVWKTDRIDLIEKISSMNESIQYQLTHRIGHPPFDHFPATGLYLIMQETLSQIFDSTLKDNDAAMEGLTRLSIWHLKDYQDLGLLPFFDQRNVLDKELFLTVQKQLERLDIDTVGKLKKNFLFSKSLLEDYIRRHRSVLSDDNQ